MQKSTAKSPKSTATRRRPGRNPLQNPAGSPDLRALMDRRNRLYQEARKNPDSEADDMVQMFLLSGMLADAAAERRTPPPDERRTAQLESTVREQRRQLDAIARITEEAKTKPWDEMAVYNRIAEIVGLRAPLKMYHATEEDQRQTAGEQKEDPCQTQPLQTPAQPSPTTK